MSKTLQEIVSAAIAGAGHQKTAGVAASAASTQPVSLEEELFAELDMLGVKEASDEEESEPKKEEKKDEDKPKTKEAAAYGHTLARALTEAAHVVQKLATDPAVTESQHSHATTVSPKAQTPGGPAIAMQNGAKSTGPTGTLPNDGHEAPKSASDERIAQDPEAARRLLNAKLAAFRVCQETGQTQAAEEHKVAALALRKKLAEAGALPTSSGGEGTHVPDNAGMASLTKSQARDANTREATAFYGVPTKKDNAVQAHVGRTDGLKLSSLASVLGKGDRVLQAVGGKALDSAARGAKSVAGAAENRLFNGGAAGKLKTKVLEGATVHGHNAASRLTAASGSEAGRRAAGAATLGAGAIGAGKMLGTKKEAGVAGDLVRHGDKALQTVGKAVLNAGSGAAAGTHRFASGLRGGASGTLKSEALKSVEGGALNAITNLTRAGQSENARRGVGAAVGGAAAMGAAKRLGGKKEAADTEAQKKLDAKHQSKSIKSHTAGGAAMGTGIGAWASQGASRKGKALGIAGGLAGGALGGALGGKHHANTFKGYAKERASSKDQKGMDKSMKKWAPPVNAGLLGATGAMVGDSLKERGAKGLKGNKKAIIGALGGAAAGAMLGKRHAKDITSHAKKREAAGKKED